MKFKSKRNFPLPQHHWFVLSWSFLNIQKFGTFPSCIKMFGLKAAILHVQPKQSTKNNDQHFIFITLPHSFVHKNKYRFSCYKNETKAEHIKMNLRNVNQRSIWSVFQWILFYSSFACFFMIDKYLKTQFLCRIRTSFQKENLKNLRMILQKNWMHQNIIVLNFQWFFFELIIPFHLDSVIEGVFIILFLCLFSTFWLLLTENCPFSDLTLFLLFIDSPFYITFYLIVLIFFIYALFGFGYSY